MWIIVLCAQVVQNSSIITACVPYLKPFLESLESGMIRSDNIPQHDDTMESVSGGYDGHKLSKLTLKHEKLEHALRPCTASIVITSGGQDESPEWDTESQRSSSRIIKTTRTWAVGTT